MRSRDLLINKRVSWVRRNFSKIRSEGYSVYFIYLDLIAYEYIIKKKAKYKVQHCETRAHTVVVVVTIKEGKNSFKRKEGTPDEL